MLVDCVLAGGRIVTEGGVFDADVAIDGGRIVAEGAADDARSAAARSGRRSSGAAGVIDVHVHVREPA